MRIILGSDLSFILNYGYALAGIPKSELKIGYVTTASKPESDRSFFEIIKSRIRENGYTIEEIDIEDKNQEEIERFFEDKNVVHVEGGNTFYLLKAIRNTGFNEVINRLLDRGVVYIGTSAGAYVMCPTIEVASWSNDGKDRCGVLEFTAFGYVPFLLKVHYVDSDEKIIRDKLDDLEYPLRLLRDGQGILVDGKDYKFVGGEETRIYK